MKQTTTKKFTKVFASYEAAIKFERNMKKNGYDCKIYDAYNVAEQRTLYTVHVTKEN